MNYRNNMESLFGEEKLALKKNIKTPPEKSVNKTQNHSGYVIGTWVHVILSWSFLQQLKIV